MTLSVSAYLTTNQKNSCLHSSNSERNMPRAYIHHIKNYITTYATRRRGAESRRHDTLLDNEGAQHATKNGARKKEQNMKSIHR